MSRPPKDASIPLRWQATPDWRSRGTFTQFAREFLARRAEGAIRDELIAASGRAHDCRLPHSRKGLLAAIRRLIRLGELVEKEGRLFGGRPRTAARPGKYR